VTGWQALFAPPGTPAPVIKRLNEEVAAGLRQADLLQSFDAQGLDAAASSPATLAALVKPEVAKWAKVIEVARIPQQ